MYIDMAYFGTPLVVSLSAWLATPALNLGSRRASARRERTATFLRNAVLVGCSGDLVSRLSDSPYEASSRGLQEILTGLTKSTDHPSLLLM